MFADRNRAVIDTGCRVRRFKCADGPMQGAILRIGEDDLTGVFTSPNGKGRYRFNPENCLLYWEEQK